MSKKDNIVIGLNGIPGCGKTTIINEVEKILKEEDISYSTLQDVYFYKENSKISKMLTTVKALLSPSQFKINLKIFKYMSEYSFNKQRSLYTLKLIKLFYQLKSFIKNESYEIILLEEGLIQYSTSISHIEDVKDKELIQAIMKEFFNDIESVIFINCNLKIESTIERIRSRDTTNRRFGGMDDPTLYDALQAREDALNVMRNSEHGKDQLDINTEHPPLDNAKKIFNEYKSIYNDF